MKLISLTIKINDISKRVVNFKKGLNIVTNKRGYGHSGNSVGKSTLFRVVDYLFLASIKPVYFDEEFKKPNEQIQSLIMNNTVEAELSFIGIDDNPHVISRNLSINSNEFVFKVDNKTGEKNFYESKLKELFFNVYSTRPSVRIIIPKFIRNDNHKMLHTLNFLDKRQGKKDYNELFLYLMGFQNTQLLTDQRNAVNLKNKRTRNLKILNSLIKEQKTSSSIKEYKGEINNIEKDLLKLDFSPKYSDPLKELSSLQEKENVYTQEILKTDRKISNLVQTIESISAEGGNYLCKELKSIYRFAGVAIDSGIRSYEEVLSFHDNLIKKKKEYLNNDMPSLIKYRKDYYDKLNGVLSKREDIFLEIRSAGYLEKISSKINELCSLKESLGRVEGLVSQKEKASSDLNSAKKELDDILKLIDQEISNIKSFECTINEEFGKITKRVQGDEYRFELNYNNESGECSPSIECKSPNPDGGKKKAEVIAFDLSYINTLNLKKLKKPNFVFHDSIEDIDQKQIDVLFELSREINGQQIVSILSENMNDIIFEKYQEDVVLSLSDDDMFFKV